MELVAWLLLNPPDEPIHASVLENHVDGNPVTDGATAIEYGDESNIQHPDVGGVIVEAAGKKLKSEITLPALKQKLAELRKDKDDENLAPSVRQEAEDELAKLLHDYNRGGKVTGQAELAAEGVRKAIQKSHQ